MRYGRSREGRWRALLALLLAVVAGLPAAGSTASAAASPAYLTVEASYGAGVVTTGIPTVGGTATIAGANHLELGWNSSAAAQIATWLS
nr:hypothetical protein OG781_36455 [Streptomyces sp. NBC_00830]